MGRAVLGVRWKLYKLAGRPKVIVSIGIHCQLRGLVGNFLYSLDATCAGPYYRNTLVVQIETLLRPRGGVDRLSLERIHAFVRWNILLRCKAGAEND